MAERKCGNCKHYEPAPLFRKGWCRNPRLFSAGQNHLIGAEDLDCDRGIGSYWEAPEGEAADADPLARFTKPAGRTIAPAQPELGRTPRRTPPPPPIVVRREGQDVIERPTARRATPKGTKPAPTAIPEGYETAHEPYSWGTYLRRSYPAIGVILLLGAVWIWSARLLSGGPPVTPTVPLIAPETPATVVAVPVITPTAAGAAPAASTAPAAAPGTIGPGANIIIQTPGGAGANIRQTPSAGGALVTALNDGAALTITGASQDADGYTWWPVTGGGVTGWVAGSLIAPAP